MSVSAASWANEIVGSVRDDPAGRMALMERCYHGPFGKAPDTFPFAGRRCRSCAGSFGEVCCSRRPPTGPAVRGGVP